MKILAIELKNYNRLMLNGFSKIRIDFENPIQQILGTNGCGKSSLMAQLNPLAGDHRDFDKDGYKHIWISFRGSLYECISDFSNGNKHTFIKDNVILNDNGNAKLQNELAFKYFKFNSDVRDLLLGVTKFTHMSVAERRKWLNLLSVTDYTYANSVYQFFRERHRDINGSLKENKRRLVFEQSKLLKETEIKKIQTEVLSVHKEITELLELRENTNISIEELMQKYNTSHTRVIELTRNILLTDAYNNTPCSNKEDLILHIENIKLDLNSAQVKLSERQKQFSKVHSEFDILKKTGALDENKLLDQIQLLKTEQSKLKSSKKFKDINITNPNEALNVLLGIENELFTLLEEIKNDSENKFTQSNLTGLRTKLISLKDLKEKITNELNSLNAKEHHLTEHKTKGNIRCPNCSHEWILNYNETLHKKVKENIQSLGKELVDLKKQIEELDKEIYEFEEYGQKIRHYLTICSSSKLLDSFWDYVKKENLIKTSSSSIYTSLLKLKDDLYLDIKISGFEKDIIETKKLIDLSKLVEDKNIVSLEAKISEIDKDISNLTDELKYLTKKLSDTIAFKTKIDQIEENYRELNTLLESLKGLDEITVKTVRFDVVNKFIRERQSQLAIKEDILAEVNNQKQRVLFLDEEITKQEVDSDALAILVKEISPTEGLIAEGLSNFINIFIDKMNKEISKIWSYPLRIGGCSLVDEEDSVDLDYKFPLLIADQNKKVSDVFKGSEGMQEIINIAFRLIAMQFLDMGDYPIYLDEFGNTFDEHHRTKAVYLIKSLVENFNFTQLFMISHYFTMHGAISNAQVCVLNHDNINVVGEHNAHVIFN